ncbi:DNA polymerase processivity subunit [Felid alphaherpesvirus 1]|nr:DNA polymerase processivity subunit [Felid alphaherpesvirus 1]
MAFPPSRLEVGINKAINHPAQVVHAGPLLGGAKSNTIFGNAVLEEDKLREVMTILTPISTSLKNSFLVFSADGMLIHTSVCHEQIYIPISKNQFSSYRWTYGQPAVFLANIDGRRSLLDVFKTTGRKSATKKVIFEITNVHPGRMLNQVVFNLDLDGGLSSSQLIKSEFNNYCVMLPTRVPDLTLEFSKPQLNKILDLGKRIKSTLVFESTVRETINIISDVGRVTFTTTHESADGNQDSRCILRSLPRSHIRGNVSSTVNFSGVLKPFRLALESPVNFFQLLRKLKLTHTDVSLNFFFTPSTTPMLSLTTRKPVGVMMFFFCTTECLGSSESIKTGDMDDPSTTEEESIPRLKRRVLEEFRDSEGPSKKLCTFVYSSPLCNPNPGTRGENPSDI